MESKWISVKERLPEFEQLVLVYCRPHHRNKNHYKMVKRTEVKYGDSLGWCWNYVLGTCGHFDHWMPLPEPPKGEDDDK